LKSAAGKKPVLATPCTSPTPTAIALGKATTPASSPQSVLVNRYGMAVIYLKGLDNRRGAGQQIRTRFDCVARNAFPSHFAVPEILRKILTGIHRFEKPAAYETLVSSLTSALPVFVPEHKPRLP
jgi:hypothetical protein